MAQGKVGVLRRVPFALETGTGVPATGVTLANISVIVRNSNNAATEDASATVSEDGIGDYFFTISAAYSTTNLSAVDNGVAYGNVTVNDTAPVLRVVIPFEIEYFDVDLDDVAVPGDEMDLITDAVDANSVATSGANEIRDSILSDSTPFQGADIATILVDTDTTIPALIAAVQADTDDIQTRLPATLISGRMRSHVEAFDAGVIDAASIATDAIDADAIAADAIGSSELATSAVNEIRDSILSDSTPFPGANIDATISSRSDFDETTDPVELLDSGGAAGTSAAELVADIDVSLSAAHGAGAWDGTESDWTTVEREQIRFRLAMDGTQTDPTTGVGTVEDILADTAAIEPLVSANVDATISSRATQASVDIIDANVDTLLAATVSVSLAATAGSSSTEVRTGATQVDGFFDDLVLVVVNSAGVVARRITGYLNTNGAFTVDPALPFTPAISDPVHVLNRLASSAIDTAALVDAFWDEDIVAAHGGADSAGLLLRVLGALISQRTNNANLNVLLGVADTAGTDLPEQINTELETVQGHGAGSWQTGAGVTDWSSGERDQIRFRLALDGAQTDPTTGVGTVEDILADTSAIDARLPSDPADESLQQASHTQTQADIAALNDLSALQVENAVWDATIASHLNAGSTGEALDNASAGSAVDWTTSEREQIRDALGVDGTKTTAQNGQLQEVGTFVDVSATFTGTSYRALAHLLRNGQRVTSGLTGATLTLLDPQGNVEFGPVAMTAEPNGTFSHDQASVSLSDNINFYTLVSITDAVGTETELIKTPTVA